jgi:hypothetical protein
MLILYHIYSFVSEYKSNVNILSLAESDVNGRLGYSLLSDGKSILSDALDEYKRQVLNKYEDKKKKENGSVSILDKE